MKLTNKTPPFQQATKISTLSKAFYKTESKRITIITYIN